MKKLLFSVSVLFFFILISFLTILSTTGIETKKFNDLISNKIYQTNSEFNLRLNKIKFKIDIKKLSLFLQTNNPQINYRETVIPIKNIKVFIDFGSILTSDLQIKKINVVLEDLEIKEFKNLSSNFKPSNFNSFINNNILEGRVNSEIEIFLKDNNIFENFIIRGEVNNLKAELANNLIFEKIKFNFFADKTDVLLKNIFGKNELIDIFDGDLKVILSPNLELKGNFQSRIKYLNKVNEKNNFLTNFKYFNNLNNLNTDLNNSFFISFDETYKVKKYEYKNNGKIVKASLNFDKPIKNLISKNEITQISILNTEISSEYNSIKKITKLSGKYILGKNQPAVFNLESEINKKIEKLKLNLEYSNIIDFNLINYSKPKDEIANIYLDLIKLKDKISINKVNYKHKENIILLQDLKLNKNRFLSFKEISVITQKNSKINNNFKIKFGKVISIKGSQFDATNLPKFFNQEQEPNKFVNFNKEIDIDFKNIIVPLSERLKNFKLIGVIENGKFIKISSKGSFNGNNFLDISMRNDKKNKKKYLEIYSDLTKPFLTEFSFFKGVTDGKLLYSSEISEKNSVSKLKIENFKVVNAPGMIKLLSLADLSGLADLAEGEGISFDSLEINMKKSNQVLEISEILALGPSISVLMEGYQNTAVTSLRGTLVPAKTLNKLISKIPLIGDIVIPKEAGEGLFGISFKMKGPPGKIKTTIDPIRTITPRFIQKIVDRKKDSK